MKVIFINILLLLTVAYTLGNDDESSITRLLRSIDQTCSNIHALLTYQRKIVNIRVTKEAPVRVKVDMELTSPSAPSIKQYFSVEGMVCDRGFDRNAATAACRSLNKRLQMFTTGYEWEAENNNLYDKCYFDYNKDPFVVPCDFVLNNFNCSSTATNLNDCKFSPLFEHSCTRDMHVGISCS